MYVEDADLCRRAHELGMLTAFTPDVQVTHAHGGSSRLNVDCEIHDKAGSNNLQACLYREPHAWIATLGFACPDSAFAVADAYHCCAVGPAYFRPDSSAARAQ